MKVLKRINYTGSDETTLHYVSERKYRENIYLKEFGKGDYIASFIVDNNHPNGLEIHVLYSSRLIYVYNLGTKKLVTILYGRNGQLKRYFKRFPKHLFKDYEFGYNNL